jgi:hypothetical protein
MLKPKSAIKDYYWFLVTDPTEQALAILGNNCDPCCRQDWPHECYTLRDNGTVYQWRPRRSNDMEPYEHAYDN